MLFEENKRNYNGPKTYIEGDYEYLERSARSESAKVREFLNHWVAQLPEGETREVVARIQSGDKKNFESATFEVILFAMMSQLGCSLQIHPDLGNESTKHPDFLVTTPEGDKFYLEAVLASEFSAAELAAEKRKNVVLESIERLDSPNFFLGINAEGNPDTPPRGKALRGELSRWLESLDPDVVAEEVDKNGFDAIPTMVWCHDNWDIKFEAIPIKPDRRGRGQRVIGTLSSGARWINGWEPIRDAIRSKGNHYGELDKPLVVAVNVDGFSLGRIDEMQALFGQEEYIFNRSNLDAQPEMHRAPNGAWHGREGPQYTRVSGAWLFGTLNPWNVISRKNTLYFNPWSTRKLPEFLKQLNHATVVEEKMKWVDGSSLREMLGLPESWPE